MKYILNPVSQELDKISDIEAAVDKDSRAPAKFADLPILKNSINARPKREMLDYINQKLATYDGVPLSQKNKRINAALAKGGTPKKEEKELSYTEQYNKYFGGGIPKNKTPLATEKNNIVIAMSEAPAEEFQLQLGAEIEQFMKWLKENKNGTYKEYLEDKKAMLTDEQKKDPKIIELPLPSFKEEIEKMEREQEKEDDAYKIILPRDPLETRFKALLLQSELEKENDSTGGLARFDTRRRFTGGGNGITPKTPQTYQKQIEDLFGIQLTGQETIAELLEMVRKLNEQE